MKKTIKRVGACALIAAMAVAAVGCAKTEPTPTTPVDSTVAPETTPVETTPIVEEVGSQADALAAVLIDTYGENYLAVQMLDAETLEALYEISPDMYDDFFAAKPMMMTHVDEVIMLHSTDTAPLMEKLNAYKEVLAADTWAYPANLPRLGTATVVDFENGWVGLFILGGQADMALQEEWGEDTEKAVTYYTEQNQKGVDALKQYFADGIVPEIDVYTIMIPAMTEEVIMDEVLENSEEVVDDMTDAMEDVVSDLADAIADVADDATEAGEDTAEDAN